MPMILVNKQNGTPVFSTHVVCDKSYDISQHLTPGVYVITAIDGYFGSNKTILYSRIVEVVETINEFSFLDSVNVNSLNCGVPMIAIVKIPGGFDAEVTVKSVQELVELGKVYKTIKHTNINIEYKEPSMVKTVRILETLIGE